MASCPTAAKACTNPPADRVEADYNLPFVSKPN